MNEDEKFNSAIDASCRVPLLALFGGAALWLMAGLALAIIASLTFHKPDMFADCSWLAYGRAQAAANDLLVYGFCIPAALGVMLWIFARLSEAELALPLSAIAAANLWHLGVLIGTVSVLAGDSIGFNWAEFPRGSSVFLFAAFWLVAISALATFGARRRRELHPAHWFLLAAIFWFPWIYSTANLFLNAWPVRGVTQSVIDWWFGNNLIFIWLSLAGLGTAFYFLPKLAGRAPSGRDHLLFGFWTLILFGTWCGVPQDAPVPAWLPASSAVAAALMIIPVIAIAIAYVRTVRSPDGARCKGGPFCHIKFGTVAFLLATLMLIAEGCPKIARILEFTWFGQAQIQLQILGFFTIVMVGAIYELMPGVMNFRLPFPKFVRLQHWLFIAGVVLLTGSLTVAGVVQGFKLNNPKIPFADVSHSTLIYFRFSTTGLLLLFLGSLLFAANIFVMTLKWKIGVLKAAIAAVKAPLDMTSDSASLRRDREVGS